MNILDEFKNLFLDVWKTGISGVNISEILIALVIFLFFLFLRGIFAKFVIKRFSFVDAFLSLTLFMKPIGWHFYIQKIVLIYFIFF